MAKRTTTNDAANCAGLGASASNSTDDYTYINFANATSANNQNINFATNFMSVGLSQLNLNMGACHDVGMRINYSNLNSNNQNSALVIKSDTTFKIHSALICMPVDYDLEHNSSIEFKLSLSSYRLSNEHITPLKVKGKLKVLPEVCALIMDKLKSGNMKLSRNDCQLLKSYQSIDPKIIQFFLAQNYSFNDNLKPLNDEISRQFLSLTVCENPIP